MLMAITMTDGKDDSVYLLSTKYATYTCLRDGPVTEHVLTGGTCNIQWWW